MKLKKKNEKSKKDQLKKLIRPMFVSTIMFGYATEGQVEKVINDMFKNYTE